MKNCFMMQVVLFLTTSVLYADTAKFTALVLDYDTGKPIPGVTVRANFTKNIGWRAWSDSAKPDFDIKVTDQDGRCRLSGKTNCGEACCWVSEPPQGYYAEGGWGYEYKEKNLFGVWQPDNLVATIRLDRVVNPIPLYVAKSKSLKIAKMGSQLNDEFSIAYDLLNNDWLPPLGKGEVGDVVLASRKTRLGEEPYRYPSGIHTNAFYRYDVRVMFPGAGNGVVEFIRDEQRCLKLRVAPDAGYNAEYVSWAGRLSRTEYKNNFDKNRHFCFRIRTEHDKDGKIKNAYYGKIYGDFRLEVREEGVADLSFLYYLNPTPNDHNLEWDMKHNLCSDPGDLSQPQP